MKIISFFQLIDFHTRVATADDGGGFFGFGNFHVDQAFKRRRSGAPISPKFSRGRVLASFSTNNGYKPLIQNNA